MNWARKTGIAIVMLIPACIGGGAVWHISRSWIVVVFWLLLMIILTGAVISGKFSKP